MTFVVDSSVALSWCFEDERSPTSLAALERIASTGAVAPSLWVLEVLNGLAMAQRRGRIDSAQRQTLAGFLRELPIDLDDATAAQAWTATARVAERFGLSVYDASYLELAQRRELPLATLDRELLRAAPSAGVRLFE